MDELNDAHDDDMAACGNDEKHCARVMGRTLLKQAIGELEEGNNMAGMQTLWMAIMQRMDACEQLYG